MVTYGLPSTLRRKRKLRTSRIKCIQIMSDASEINDSIEKLIRQKCGRMGVLPNGWHLFSFHGRHFIYESDGKGLLQFGIPYLMDSERYDMESVILAINDTNCRMRFIKAVLLDNGVVALTYDYMVMGAEHLGRVADHIIETLDRAADYFLGKFPTHN